MRQDYLWDSLLVFIDCSAIGVRAHEKLFMPNRENLRHGDLKFRLEKEIEEKLRQAKDGSPSCAITPQISPLWTCSLFLLSVLTCSMHSSSSD